MSLYSSWHHSPDAIASAAYLYRYQCAGIHSASVLEIGCGDGEALARQAALYPQNSFTGVDIDETRIARAQKQVRSLNNLHFHCLSLPALLSSDAGRYDYIIIPSLYTLLDSDTREALLGWCAQHLSEQGILAVHWHTLPGASENREIQQALALHCRDCRQETDWAEHARDMLTFMDTTTRDTRLKRRVQQALLLNDTELLALYRDEKEDAEFFIAFASRANQLNLRILGDVIPRTELPDHYGQPVSGSLQHIQTEAISLLTQQYLDFAVQRRERFTLMLPLDTRQQVTETPDLAQLSDMHWAACYRPIDGKAGYHTPTGDALNTSTPQVYAILDWLHAAWPRSLSTAQLVYHTLAPEAPENHETNILNVLQALYRTGPAGLYVSRSPSPYNLDGNKPLRLTSEPDAADRYASLRGEIFPLPAAEQTQGNQPALIRDLSDAAAALNLTEKGLLSGSAGSWRHLYGALMAQGNETLMRRCIRAYLLAITPETHYGLLSGQRNTAARLPAGPPPSDLRRRIARVRKLAEQGEIRQAQEQAETLLARCPEEAPVLALMAFICSGVKDYPRATRILCRQLAVDENQMEVLAHILTSQGNRKDISECQRQIARFLIKTPGSQFRSLAWTSLSAWYQQHNDGQKEAFCLQQALDISPDNSILWVKMGLLYSVRGRQEDAEAFIRKGMTLPGSPEAQLDYRASLMFTLSHNPVLSEAEKFAEARIYGRQASQWARTQPGLLPPPQPSSDKPRIRVGFVSGDLRQHPVHYFLWPIWHALNRTRYNVLAYHTAPGDEITRQYVDSATLFRQVEGLSLSGLARTIREDQVDILIDLSGFTCGHRLPTFALKPAPVQISGIGFAGTTGLTQMDYYFTYHGLAAPGELDAFFTEKLVHLPSTKYFEYPQDAPDVNSLPALKNGYLTLGSFNRPQKITAELLDNWANILRTLPDARLLIGYMADDAMAEDYRTEMSRRGIAADRLDFHKKCAMQDYLALHHQVDILLDSHPYSAGTTALYALWMGVPLITQIGESAVSRTAAAAMHPLGLDIFVAHTPEEYVQTVVDLNADYAALDTLRRSMRDRILRREPQRHNNACYFEAMLETVWQRYVRGEEPSALVIPEPHAPEPLPGQLHMMQRDRDDRLRSSRSVTLSDG